jgi:hypothetical protein
MSMSTTVTSRVRASVSTPHRKLFLLAVTAMAEGTDQYHETDERFIELVRMLALTDDGWLVRFLAWLRGFDELASAAVVGSAEMARTRLANGLNTSGGTRKVIDSALARADEPGLMLAYWFRRYGRTVPKPIRHGLADAATRLYDEAALAEYERSSADVRFADVISLVHPKAGSREQQGLFQHVLGRRGSSVQIPAGMTMLRARATLYDLNAQQRRALLDSPIATELFGAAGMTAALLPGWLSGQAPDARAWTALLPHMSYRDRLAHLRDLDAAGLNEQELLADLARIAAERIRPLTVHAARREVTAPGWDGPLEAAADAALAQVPVLTGRTLILVDRSASMFTQIMKGSAATVADQAAVFGACLALRSADTTLVQFGTSHSPLPFSPGQSLTELLGRFGEMGDGNAAAAVRACFDQHDRIVIVTDEPHGSAWQGEHPAAAAPVGVPVYIWNVAGMPQPAAPGRADIQGRYVFVGLSDAAFDVIPLIEAGRRDFWPF